MLQKREDKLRRQSNACHDFASCETPVKRRARRPRRGARGDSPTTAQPAVIQIDHVRYN